MSETRESYRISPTKVETPAEDTADVNILEFGFKEVGECQLAENLTSGVRFVLNDLRDDRVIYAYTVNGEVKYIGVCDNTATTLKTRMSRYQAMIGAGTNKRITEQIKAHLRNGDQVRVLAWKPDVQLTVKGLEVDLVKGLENPLIRALKPEWNIKS
jgi:hypothetical protein